MSTAPAASTSMPEGKTLRPGSPLKRAWAYLRQMFVLGSFFGFGLVVNTIGAFVHLILSEAIPTQNGQKLLGWMFRSWLKVGHLLGVFQVSFPEAPRLRHLSGTIIAPNHPTVMDAVILLARIPRTVCIMRASLANNPCMGTLAKLAGYITNDHGSALIRDGKSKIEDGENLLIFPEGTRTEDKAVNAFKPGFALIAKKSRAPIQTLFIERDARYLGKGVSFLAPTRLPIRYRVTCGELLYPQDGESASAFSHRVENYFRARLRNTGEAILRKEPDS